MKFKIITSLYFVKNLKQLAKKYPSITDDIAKLAENLKENPLEGTPLGKDCYKIRMAITSKNKGKSGGSRVITCVKIVAQTVILLSIYDKSEMETITDDDLSELLSLAGIE